MCKSINTTQKVLKLLMKAKDLLYFPACCLSVGSGGALYLSWAKCKNNLYYMKPVICQCQANPKTGHLWQNFKTLPLPYG